MAGFPSKCLLLALLPVEAAKLNILRGDDCIGAGDTVLALADADDIDALTNVLTRAR